MWIIRLLLRLALVGLLMAALGAVAIYGSWKLIHPFVLQREQHREIAQLEQRVAWLKREHASLKEAATRLATEAGKAEELRRMGYVRPKERILRFLKAPAPAARVPRQPTRENAGVKDRIKRWLERRLAPAPSG